MLHLTTIVHLLALARTAGSCWTLPNPGRVVPQATCTPYDQEDFKGVIDSRMSGWVHHKPAQPFSGNSHQPDWLLWHRQPWTRVFATLDWINDGALPVLKLRQYKTSGRFRLLTHIFLPQEDRQQAQTSAAINRTMHGMRRKRDRASVFHAGAGALTPQGSLNKGNMGQVGHHSIRALYIPSGCSPDVALLWFQRLTCNADD